jgi:hypothetical protein
MTGRARYSTVGMALFFLATLALYILVRPASSTQHPDDPAPNTAVPTSTASSTAPTSGTERPSTSAPTGNPTAPALTPAPTSGASPSRDITTERSGPVEPGQR